MGKSSATTNSKNDGKPNYSYYHFNPYSKNIYYYPNKDIRTIG